jgi:hypothetical protein
MSSGLDNETVAPSIHPALGNGPGNLLLDATFGPTWVIDTEALRNQVDSQREEGEGRAQQVFRLCGGLGAWDVGESFDHA